MANGAPTREAVERTYGPVGDALRADPRSLWYDGRGGARLEQHGGSQYRAAVPQLVDAFGRAVPDRNDPAFQTPTDPLARNLRDVATLIHRELPNVTTQTGYAPNDVRNAIAQLVIGLFDVPSQMTDTVLADSRVHATLSSRVGGLLGRPVTHRCPPGLEDDPDAQRCRDVWAHHWDQIFPEDVASEFLRWTIMQSFAVAQLLWDTSGKYAIPEPRNWHPRYTYYHWLYLCYVALHRDGQDAITPGDGHWVLHAPCGAYRGWMRGAVWPIAPWWLARQYTLRDWARYCERHGMPIILAMTPAAADPAQSGQFKASLSTLGQETVVQLPQGVEPQYSYDMKLLEATDQGWQGFHQLIEQCNMEITLAIMGQNLTTEVKEGSYAAARVHSDVRQSVLESDARALTRTIRQQIARPFAAMNFSRPEIAPVTTWDLTPYEDDLTKAQTLQAFANAVYGLRRAGKQINGIAKLAKGFGLDLQLADVLDVEPIQGKGGGE